MTARVLVESFMGMRMRFVLASVLGMMLVSMPAHAVQGEGDANVSIACGDAETAHSAWGMVHCSDSDRAIATATATVFALANDGAVGQAALACSIASNTITCTGGEAAQVANGITLEEILGTITGTSNITGATTININNIDADVNTTGSRVSGIEIDGTGSNVTGTLTSLTVNNQTTSSTKRDVQVRRSGSDRAALYVASAAAATVTSASRLVFAQRSDNTYSTRLRGITVEAASGTVTITNSGAIGFTAACASDCGRTHRGIVSTLSTGTGAHSVTNSGAIDLASASGNAAFEMIGGARSVTNTGNISVAGDVVVLGVTGGNSTINFNGGTVTATGTTTGRLVQLASAATSTVTVNVAGGTATGKFSLGGGADNVNVNNGGTLVLDSGASAFGGGADALTVNSGGALHLGTAAAGSDGVTVSALETFTVNAGATLRFYLDSTFTNTSSSATAFEFDLTNGSFAFAGSGTITLELYLPTTYTKTTSRSAFTLIDVSGTGRTLTFSTAAGTTYTVDLKIFRGGQELTVGGGALTKSASGEDLQVAWSSLTAETALACAVSNSNRTLTCTNGTQTQLANGLTMSEIFGASSISSITGAGTININGLDFAVNTSSASNAHGIEIDGTDSTNGVSGALTVNHQTTGTKRDVQVRGADQAALYVESNGSVTVSNGANLVFSTSSGGSYNDGLLGMEAIAATSSGAATITNSGRIGFAATCTANCGSDHIGILSAVASGSTAVNSITNSGIVNIASSGGNTDGIAFELESGTQTFTNTGTINVDGDAVSIVSPSAAATVGFNGGTVTAGGNLVSTTSSQNVTVNVAGGTATGKFTFAGGNDTVNVNSGGTLIIGNGTSAFAGGTTDSFTVNSGGTLHIGDATNGSDGVTISGLETFTIKGGSTVRMFMDSFGATPSPFTFADGDVAFDGSGNVTLELVLPSGYTLADRAAFTLIDVNGSNNTLDFTGGFVVGSNITVNLYRVSGSSVTALSNALITATEAANERLQLQWLDNSPSTMNCTYASLSTTVTCTGGTANSSEFTNGIRLGRIFTDVSQLSSGSFTGNLTVAITSPAAVVNSAGTGHGITLDGTATGSVVTGNLTVNHQTTGTKQDVQVRGSGNKAALYVKSNASVAVTNAANLSFAEKSGGGFNTGLRGIWAIAAANGTSTVTNSGTISFAASCSSDCGASRSGIYSNIASGTGANTVTNSGTITMRPNATLHTNGVAIGVDGGTPTVTNTGNITVDYIAVFATNFTGAATVNFNSGTVTSDNILVFSSSSNNALTVNVNGGTAQGTLSLGNGNNAVNVNNGGTLVLDDATSTSTIGFAGGTDTMTVNSGGALHIGDATNGSDSITITGLETFTINASSTIRFYMDGDFSASAVNLFTISGDLAVNGTGSAAPIFEFYVDDDYTIANRTAFKIIDVNDDKTVTVSDATLTGLGARAYVVKNGVRYGGTFTFTKNASNDTDDALSVAWTNLQRAFGCSLSGTTVSCLGGVADELKDGLSGTTIFTSANVTGGEIDGNATINLNDFSATVNTEGTEDGIEIDGVSTGSEVTGNLTVNNQTTSTTKRDVQVRGSGNSALYVESGAAVTVTNASNLVFVGTGNGRRGIEAIADGSGNSTIINNSGATIGFASGCTTNCGTGHYGISSGTGSGGTHSVTNNGTIDLGSAGNAFAITAEGGTSATITNTGNITVRGGTAVFVASNGTVNFNGGTVIADVLATSSTAAAITMNVNGGTVTGRLNLRLGNDAVNVNNGGVMTLAVAASAFGVLSNDNDSLTVNSGGTLIFGDNTGTNGSKSVTITGLNTFTANAGSTLRFFLDSGFNNISSNTHSIATGAAMTFNGGSRVQIVVPTSGYTIGNRTTAFVLASGSGLTLSSAAATALSGNARVIQGTTSYNGTITLAKNGNNLQVTWSNLVAEVPFACSATTASGTTTVACEDGTAFGMENGLTGATIFTAASVSGGSITGNAVFNFNDLGAAVNTAGTGFGIRINGTATGSLVSGNVTVNNQTNTATNDKKAIQVRAENNAAMRVRSAGTMTVNNAAPLHFAEKAGGGYDGSLTGLYAISPSSITITNSSTIGFARDCGNNCGQNTIGILSFLTAAGTHTISNSGTIDLRNAGGSSAISVTAGAGTVTNTGTITASNSNAVVFGSTVTGGTVNFNSGTVTASVLVKASSTTAANTVNIRGGTATGKFEFVGGADTVNVTGGTLVLRRGSVANSGISAFGGGTDSLTVNGGTLVVGNSAYGAKGVTINGLETFTVTANSTLRLYLTRTGSNFDRAMNPSGTAVSITSSGNNTPTFELYLPSGYTLADQTTAFNLITGTSLTVSDAALTALGNNVKFYQGGTELAGTATFTKSGNNLQLTWSNLSTPTNCSRVTSAATNTITCAGGSALSGLTTRSIFDSAGITNRRIGSGDGNGNATFVLGTAASPFAANINVSGSQYGINIGSVEGGVFIHRNIVVNHQSYTGGTKRTLFAGGETNNSVGLRVRSTTNGTALTVRSGAPITFKAKAAGGYADGIQGIYAEVNDGGANGNYSATVTNTGNIGFASACTANCGKNHRAIYVENNSSNGTISVTNSGDLTIGSSSSSTATELNRGISVNLNGASSATIANSGDITGGTNSVAIFLNGVGSGANTISLTAGDINAGYIVYTQRLASNFTTAITMSGGTARGRLRLGLGTDTVTVSGGTMTLTGGGSDFRGGGDSLTVSGTGTVVIDSNVSALANFTVNAGATLGVAMGAIGNRGLLGRNMDSVALVLMQSGSGSSARSIKLNVYLPSGHTIVANDTYDLDLLEVNTLAVKNGSTTLTGSARTAYYDAIQVTFYTLDASGNASEYLDGEQMRASFTGETIKAFMRTVANPLVCTVDTAQINCTGGGSQEGFSAVTAFKKANRTTSLANALVELTAFGSDVNQSATSPNHGIEIDGTLAESRITERIEVRVQKSQIPARNKVFVSASDRSALFVKGGQETIIDSVLGGYEFKKDGTSYNNSLTGITAIGTRNMTITNSSPIGFASSDTTARANRGNRHVGIFANYGGGNVANPTLTITNSGDINLEDNSTTAANASTGIDVQFGSGNVGTLFDLASGAVTINNTANVKAYNAFKWEYNAYNNQTPTSITFNNAITLYVDDDIVQGTGVNCRLRNSDNTTDLQWTSGADNADQLLVSIDAGQNLRYAGSSNCGLRARDPAINLNHTGANKTMEGRFIGGNNTDTITIGTASVTTSVLKATHMDFGSFRTRATVGGSLGNEQDTSDKIVNYGHFHMGNASTASADVSITGLDDFEARSESNLHLYVKNASGTLTGGSMAGTDLVFYQSGSGNNIKRVVLNVYLPGGFTFTVGTDYTVTLLTVADLSGSDGTNALSSTDLSTYLSSMTVNFFIASGGNVVSSNGQGNASVFTIASGSNDVLRVVWRQVNALACVLATRTINCTGGVAADLQNGVSAVTFFTQAGLASGGSGATTINLNTFDVNVNTGGTGDGIVWDATSTGTGSAVSSGKVTLNVQKDTAANAKKEVQVRTASKAAISLKGAGEAELDNRGDLIFKLASGQSAYANTLTGAFVSAADDITINNTARIGFASGDTTAPASRGHSHAGIKAYITGNNKTVTITNSGDIDLMVDNGSGTRTAPYSAGILVRLGGANRRIDMTQGAYGALQNHISTDTVTVTINNTGLVRSAGYVVDVGSAVATFNLSSGSTSLQAPNANYRLIVDQEFLEGSTGNPCRITDSLAINIPGQEWQGGQNYGAFYQIQRSGRFRTFQGSTCGAAVILGGTTNSNLYHTGAGETKRMEGRYRGGIGNDTVTIGYTGSGNTFERSAVFRTFGMNFSGGTDKVTNYGRFFFGNATTTSADVRILALEAFEARAQSKMSLYVKGTAAAMQGATMAGATMTVYESGSNRIELDVHLPSGFNIDTSVTRTLQVFTVKTLGGNDGTDAMTDSELTAYLNAVASATNGVEVFNSAGTEMTLSNVSLSKTTAGGNDRLTLSWQFAERALNCTVSNTTTITCIDGTNLSNGLSIATIFSNANVTATLATLTLNMGTATQSFGTSIGGSGSTGDNDVGFAIDGTTGTVQVTGDITVNNQNTAPNKQKLLVRRGGSQDSRRPWSGLYVKSAASVTITNASDVEFQFLFGSVYPNFLRGITAVSGGSGSITITNTGDVGTGTNDCASYCNAGRRLFEIVPDGTGDVTITNSGDLNMGQYLRQNAGDTFSESNINAAFYFKRSSGGSAGDITITNTGNIRGGQWSSVVYIDYEQAAGKTVTVNFNGGTVISEDLVWMKKGRAVTVNVDGGSATGRLRLNSAGDTVTVDKDATLTLGNSDFGGGTDSLTVEGVALNNIGTLIASGGGTVSFGGRASSFRQESSADVFAHTAVTGLENFTAEDNALIRVFMNSTFTPMSISGTVTLKGIQGSAFTTAPIIELHLPVGYTIADRTLANAITIFDANELTLAFGVETGNVITLANLAAKAVIKRGILTYTGTINLAEGTGTKENELLMYWSNLVAGFGCELVGNALTCLAGTAADFADGDDLTLPKFFEQAGQASTYRHTGNLTVTMGSLQDPLGGTINTADDDTAISFQGVDGGTTYVSGDLTVNHQFYTGGTKRTVTVAKGTGTFYGIFVSSARSVTLNNGAPIVFQKGSANTPSTKARGIRITAANDASASLTLDNRGNIGFTGTNCAADRTECPRGNRGIDVYSQGGGGVTITNSGNLNMGFSGNADQSVGIYVSTTRNPAVTITNTGNITGAGETRAIEITTSTTAATQYNINLNGGTIDAGRIIYINTDKTNINVVTRLRSGASVKGTLHMSRGRDEVTVGNGATLTLVGTSEFRGNDQDKIRIEDGGTFAADASGGGVTINGLRAFEVRPQATLRFHLRSGSIATTPLTMSNTGITFFGDGVLGRPTIEIVLPTGFNLANQSWFTLIATNGIGLSNASLNQLRDRIRFRRGTDTILGTVSLRQQGQSKNLQIMWSNLAKAFNCSTSGTTVTCRDGGVADLGDGLSADEIKAAASLGATNATITLNLGTANPLTTTINATGSGHGIELNNSNLAVTAYTVNINSNATKRDVQVRNAGRAAIYMNASGAASLTLSATATAGNLVFKRRGGQNRYDSRLTGISVAANGNITITNGSKIGFGDTVTQANRGHDHVGIFAAITGNNRTITITNTGDIDLRDNGNGTTGREYSSGILASSGAGAGRTIPFTQAGLDSIPNASGIGNGSGTVTVNNTGLVVTTGYAFRARGGGRFVMGAPARTVSFDVNRAITFTIDASIATARGEACGITDADANNLYLFNSGERDGEQMTAPAGGRIRTFNGANCGFTIALGGTLNSNLTHTGRGEAKRMEGHYAGGAGNDTVTIGSSSISDSVFRTLGMTFGGGTDKITNYGEFHIGGGTTGVASPDVSITGLNTFEARAGSVLAVYAKASGTNLTGATMSNTSLVLYRSGSGNTIERVDVELYIPSGTNFTTGTTYGIDLLVTGSAITGSDGTNAISDLTSYLGGMNATFSFIDSNGNVTRMPTQGNVTFSRTNSNRTLRLAWTAINLLGCRLTNSTFACSDGSVDDIGNGITRSEIFTKAGRTTAVNNATFNFNNISVDVNSSNTSTAHGIEIDGTVSGSLLTGSLTVNNQTTTASNAKKAVQVRGSGKSGVFIKGVAAVTFTNAGDIEFKRRSGQSGYDNDLRAISVTGAGRVAVTNSADIGFGDSVTRANRGNNHIGIFAEGAGVTITNSGNIDIMANGNGANAIVARGSAGGSSTPVDFTQDVLNNYNFSAGGGSSTTVTVNNTGRVTTTGNVFRSESGSGSRFTFRASGGIRSFIPTRAITFTVDTSTVIGSGVACEFTDANVVNIARFNSGTNNGATFTVPVGGRIRAFGNTNCGITVATPTTVNSNFTHTGRGEANRMEGGYQGGSGTDTVTIGSSSISDAIFRSSGMDFGAGADRLINYGVFQLNSGATANFGAGDDTLTVNSGGTLVLGDATNGSDGVTISGLKDFTVSAGATMRLFLDGSYNDFAITIASDGTMNLSGSTLEINLPNLNDRTTFFTIIDVNGGTFNATLPTVVLKRGGTTYAGVIETRLSSGDLQLKYSNLFVAPAASTLTCGFVSGTATLTCTGGQGSELAAGLNLNRLFQKAAELRSGQRTGNLSVVIGSLAATVNTSGTGHGITIDGTVIGSQVTGNLTVNNQSGTVEVRNAGKAALYVKSAAAVTVTNAADIEFKLRTNQTAYDTNLIGVSANVSGSNAITMTNSGDIGFGDTATQANRGHNHVGVGAYFAYARANKTVSITNSGDITLMANGNGTSARPYSNALFAKESGSDITVPFSLAGVNSTSTAVGGTVTVNVNNTGLVNTTGNVFKAQRTTDIRYVVATVRQSVRFTLTRAITFTIRGSSPATCQALNAQNQEISFARTDGSVVTFPSGTKIDAGFSNIPAGGTIDCGFTVPIAPNVMNTNLTHTGVGEDKRMQGRYEGGAGVDKVTIGSSSISNSVFRTLGMTFGAGADELINYGVFDITNGATVDFGAGSDTLAIRGGKMVMGNAANGSDNVTISGLETFTVAAGATLQIFMDSTFTRVDVTGNITIADGAIIEIHLPNINDKSAFSIMRTASGFTFTRAVTGDDVRFFDSSNGSRYEGTVTSSRGNSNRDWTLGWSNLTLLALPSTMTCTSNDSGATISCSGGTVGNEEFTNGLNLRRIFKDITAISEGTRNGNMTVSLLNLAAVVNSSGSSSNHGMTMDGTAVGSEVTGNLTINNQISASKRDVQVRGASKAAVYVKSQAGVTVSNGANLAFRPTAGSHSDGLRGIEVVSAGTGNAAVTNNAGTNIGFGLIGCSSNCGATHRGILVTHAGSGTVSVSNAGSINLTGAGTAAHGIRVEAGSTTGAITITNTGTINVSGAAVSVTGGASTDTAAITFGNGSVVNSNFVFSSSFAGATTVNVNSGATVSGLMNDGTGNFAMTIATGATWRTTGTSAFGAGSDSITNNGTITLGSASTSSNNVAITGLNQFTMGASGTLEFYLNAYDSNGGYTDSEVSIDGTVTLNGTIVIYLPSGFNFTTASHAAIITPLALIDATTLNLAANVSFSDLASRVKFFSRDGEEFAGSATFSEGAGEILQVTWSNLAPLSGPTTLDCSISAGSFTCSGGSVGGNDPEITRGVNIRRLFLSDTFKTVAPNGTLTGDLNLTIGGDVGGGTINTVGLRDGVFLDGSATGTLVTGAVNLNLGTAQSQGTVQVRGEGRSAVYVKSQGSVRIINYNDLIFKQATSSYRNDLRGIYAQSAGAGNVVIENNNGGDTIGFEGGCTASCGTGHRGIVVNHVGSGTVRVTNDGAINLGSAASSDAIRIEAGSNTGSITVVNRHDITATVGNAVALTGGTNNDTASITFADGALNVGGLINSTFAGDVTVNINSQSKGSITLAGGDDTINVATEQTHTLTGTSNFGGGTDTFNNRGIVQFGAITAGSRSADVTISGLTTFNAEAGSTMEFFMTPSGASYETIDLATSIVFKKSGGQQVQVNLYVPTVPTLGSNLSAFDFIDATGFSLQGGATFAEIADKIVIYGSDDRRYVADFTLERKSGDATILQLAWNALRRFADFSNAIERIERATGGVVDGRVKALAAALNAVVADDATSTEVQDFLGQLATPLSADGVTPEQVSDSIRSVFAPVYSTLMQGGWLANEDLSNFLMRQSCGMSPLSGDVRNRFYAQDRENGNVVCTRSGISASVLQRSHGNRVGFVEQMPINLVRMWDFSLTDTLYMTAGAGYTYVEHDNHLSAKSDSHRVRLGMAVNMTENGILQQEGYRLGVGLTGTFQANKVERSVLGNYAEASPAMFSYGGRLYSGYRMQTTGRSFFEPSLSVSVSGVHMEGFSEFYQDGSAVRPVNMAMKFDDVNHLFVSVSGALEFGFALGTNTSEAAEPQFKLGVTYLVHGNEIDLNSSFAAGSAPVRYEDRLSRVFVDLNIGLDVFVTRYMTGSVSYDAMIGAGGDGATRHSGKLRLAF